MILRLSAPLMSWPFALLLACCATNRPANPLELSVDASRTGQCAVSLAGQPMNAEQLYKRLREVKRGTHVKIVGDTLNVPYRCIGGAIFTIQRAKLIPDFTFAAEPPLPESNEPR